MKTALLVLSVFLSQLSLAQATKVEVKLFLPAHNGTITTTDKLTVYFLAFPGETMQVKKSVTARRVKENIYAFELPNTKLHLVGFSIGGFHAQLLCVNNTDGNAAENYDFDILLVKGKKDFTKDIFLPPCILDEDDE